MGDSIVAWSGDSGDRVSEVRSLISEAIKKGNPLFPDRRLGFEYAALMTDTPRGCPNAVVALANLRKGDCFHLGGKDITVVRNAKRLVVESDGKRSTLWPGAKRWQQFVRDVEGLLIGSYHGVDCGDLMVSMMRDPAFSNLNEK